MIQKGDMVTLDYKGYFEDGTVFDSSEQRGPLTFEVGAGQIIPGFEEAVIGMKEGEEKTIDVPAEKGYGDRDENMMQEVPKDKLGDIEPKEGMNLVASNGMPVQIKEVKDDTVVIDFNHPLVGKDLKFDIKIVGVNDPSCGSSCASCAGCQ